MAKNRMPPILYVRECGEGDDSYFNTQDDVECHAEMGEVVRVGVYKFVGLKDISVKVETTDT
jgi:hypothetical protein